MITGQLFVRLSSKVVDGRKVFQVFGVQAVEEGREVPLEGERLYTVTADDGMTRIALDPDSGVDPEIPSLGGLRTDQILTSSIWRV